MARVTIVPRSAWGSRSPKYTHTIHTPTPELWLHHTAGVGDLHLNGKWDDDMRSIQDYHMDVKGWSDIAYSFLVSQDGTIYEGRGAGIAGGHTKNHNTVSHAICLIGDYTNVEPTREALKSISDLVMYGSDQGWWMPRLSGGHRDASGASTACPGNKLYAHLDDINNVIPDTTQGTAFMLRDFIANAYVTTRGYDPFESQGDNEGTYYWLRTASNEAPSSAWTWADCLASPTLGYMVSLLKEEYELNN